MPWAGTQAARWPARRRQLVEMLHAAAGAGELVVVPAVGTSGHSARWR